ncbi:TlpA family protein disulfide reductase [Niabella drilacis]|uniref:Thiol-disulfide isomerase or thioredoxin n=1 Tax=Niabella drilacis (strain DSM 25811 / CCM 8410 / CCUG 62505 / LMG 26954 / E90) TaxID=1285928 RepID=A0A1G6XZG3_NIADE|nr:TlpA disulfide reductase family protein [Niabella drilacis]SDD82765.1 Thiol-disulfide isomerase or thioredoxin [Niabella drilacis]
MKILATVAVLALSVSLFAQKNNRALPIDDKEMDAYLRLREVPELKITVMNSTRSLNGTKVKYTVVHLGTTTQVTGFATLDDHGRAVIKMNENLPYQQVWLTVDDYLYTGILVNTDLEVVIDAGVVKKEAYLFGTGISFKGTDAGLNEALCKKTLYKKDLGDSLSSRLVQVCLDAANKQLPQSSFLVTADSIYAALKQLDDAYIKDNPGYEWAIRNQTDSRFYEWVIVALRSVDSSTNNLYKKAIAHQPCFMSNEGAGFYRNLSHTYAFANDQTTPALQDLLYLKYNTYTNGQKAVLDSIKEYESAERKDKAAILKRLYARRYTLLKKEVQAANFEQFVQRIEKNSTNPRTDILKLSLMELGKDDFSASFPLLLNSMKTGWTKQVVEQELNAFTASRKEVQQLFQSSGVLRSDSFFIGKPVAALSFGARLYRLDSIDHIDRFISNLRSKFKDRALVIDIWATWCGPCIADITNSKKLHEETKDLPVEYIYLCTTSGSDEETWKNRIGTLKPSGTHIFINEELESAFRKKLNANGGYPTYIVIDKRGNISSDRISFMSELSREKFAEATGLK